VLGEGRLDRSGGCSHPDLGQAATATLKAEALDARYIELDVVRPATIEAAAAMVAAEFQRLDVLVNTPASTTPPMDRRARSISAPSDE